MLRFEVRPVILDMLEIQKADHFLCCVLRSARKFNFGTEEGPFLMLCFKVRSSMIINVRITEGGTISYAVFQDLPLINLCKHYRGQTHSYATFRGPPCNSKHVRNTEGTPFLMLRFEVRPLLDIFEIQRADHFLCYVSRSALSF